MSGDQTKYRRGCIYYSASTKTCDYWLIMDQRRPCPPGKGCNVYRSKSSRVARFGVKGSWDKDRGKELWQQGKTCYEIAAELGCTPAAVYRYRNKHWEKEP